MLTFPSDQSKSNMFNKRVSDQIDSNQAGLAGLGWSGWRCGNSFRYSNIYNICNKAQHTVIKRIFSSIRTCQLDESSWLLGWLPVQAVFDRTLLKNELDKCCAVVAKVDLDAAKSDVKACNNARFKPRRITARASPQLMSKVPRTQSWCQNLQSCRRQESLCQSLQN